MNKNILVWYLVRQNMFLLALVFGVGIGIYILIDLFDVLDHFLKADAGLPSIAMYVVAKIPVIISQIFPAVFLISLLIQFSLMHRNREIIALTSCAVPFVEIGRVVCLYALVWSVLLFGFSQTLGTKGHALAQKIWKEEVRKKQLSQQTVWNIWFKENDRIIRIDSLTPFQGKGWGVVVYTLTKEGTGIKAITEAKRVEINGTTWKFIDTQVVNLQSFSRQTKDVMTLDVTTDPRSFATLQRKRGSQYVSYRELDRVIKGLDEAGSNVEGLRTALYAKVSYPFSLVVMACASIALTLAVSNIYGSVLLGLVVIFVYYVLFVMSTAAGENGTLAPMIAAWMPNTIFGLGFLGLLGFKAYKKEGLV